MSYGDYLTPSGAAVWLGGLHLDDCYDVRFNIEDSTSPIFDYARSEYAAITEGKTLVSGSLAITWRFSNYLQFAISNAITPNNVKSLSQLADKKNDVTRKWLLAMVDADRKERFRLLLEAAQAGPAFMQKASTIAYAVNGQLEGKSSLPNTTPMAQHKRGYGKIEPVSLWIYYGDLDTELVADRLDGVVFVGQSKAVSAGASAGGGVSSSGSPLFEIYPFFARSLTQLHMTPEGYRVNTGR